MNKEKNRYYLPLGSGYLIRQSATLFIFSNYRHNTERIWQKMIKNGSEASNNFAKALQVLEQAKLVI